MLLPQSRGKSSPTLGGSSLKKMQTVWLGYQSHFGTHLLAHQSVMVCQLEVLLIGVSNSGRISNDRGNPPFF